MSHTACFDALSLICDQEQLFITNHKTAADVEKLIKKNIRLVINLQENDHNDKTKRKFEEAKINYIHRPISDSERLSDDDMFNLIKEIHDLIKDDTHCTAGILIHCLMGVSRSSFVVIGHLMMNLPLSARKQGSARASLPEGCHAYNKCLKKVIQRRPCVYPNEGFCKFLEHTLSIMRITRP